MSLHPHRSVDGVGLHDRVAPDHVVRGLRATDPGSDLFYLGEGRWLHAVLAPQTVEQRRIAYNLCAQITQALHAGTALDDIAVRRRLRFAKLAYAGYRPVKQYDVVGAPTGAIARDFALNDWAYTHGHHGELLADVFDPNQAAKAAAHAQLTDGGMHHDVWRYAFTRSHAVTRRDATTTADTVRSGYVRHPIPSSHQAA